MRHLRAMKEAAGGYNSKVKPVEPGISTEDFSISTKKGRVRELE